MKRILIITTLILFSSYAFTDEQLAHKGINFGILAGIATPPIGFDDDINISGIQVDGSTSNTANILTGFTLGYDFTNSARRVAVGVETGLSYLYRLGDYNGTISGTNQSFSADFNNVLIIPLQLSLKFVMPFGLTIIGKGGGAYVYQNIDYSNNVTNSLNSNVDGIIPMFSVGLGWQINSFSVSAMYTRFIGESSAQDVYSNSKPVTMNLYALQLNYIFDVF